MKISLITTVYNEEKTIGKFLDSISLQTKLPDEVIIVDGGSGDATVKRIKKYDSRNNHKKIKITVIMKQGNRSTGRNEAIQHAIGEIIVCSDAGNELDKDWVKNIIKPFKDKQIDVVAGYYEGKAETVFQKCVIPYALVMPDNVDPEDFLPATRSVAFTKAIWGKTGGFDESLSHNEDYVFARKLREIGAKIVFVKDAVVYWHPRKNFRQTFVMLWRFAYGDAEAGIFRTTVQLLLARYFLGLYFIFLCLLYRSVIGLLLLITLLLVYSIWSIQKNYRYVQHKKAFMILPLLQFTADAAVLSGTMIGFLKKVRRISIIRLIKTNKLFFIIVFFYSLIEIVVLQWGIPNKEHPFPYHMDEWHQLQAVRATFAYGTPNVAGSANGTMFHFILTGFYLIPFMLLDIINLAVIKINDLAMRERIFDLLRLNTLFWGVLSLTVFYSIVRLIKIPVLLTLLLFTFTPIWLSLSNVFKYDIALMFWILLSLYFILRFSKSPTVKNYILASIPVGIALAVKISVLPLIPIYLLSYFWFMPRNKWNLKYVIGGVSLALFGLLLFGMPDTLFGKGNILHYFYENVVQFAANTANYQLGMNPYLYIFTTHYQLLFGHILYFSTVAALIYLAFIIFNKRVNRLETFILIAMCIFIFSLSPLAIYAGMNRSLVLLPFMVIVVGLAAKHIQKVRSGKQFLLLFMAFFVPFQIAESLVWIQMRLEKNPYEQSTIWIEKNIPQQSTIGVENIPIYQPLPDIIQKEYYFHDANVPTHYRYSYQIIDERTKKLPDIIVIGNDELHKKLFVKSPKKNLLERIKNEGYTRIAVFYPDLKYYSYFGNEVDFHISGLVALPNTIAVYSRR